MENSKFIFFLSLLLVVRRTFGDLHDGPDTREKEALRACVLHLSLTTETMHHLVKTGDLPPESHPDSKCIFLCFAQKLNVTDDSGFIDHHKINTYLRENLPEIEVYESAITSCSERHETDPCDKWYQFFQCLHKADSVPYAPRSGRR